MSNTDLCKHNLEALYYDEQGLGYNYAEFLSVCNEDETIASKLFSLAYWTSPQLHFFLDEELPIARQTRHNTTGTRWLQFKEPPSQAQGQALHQSGWRVLDSEQRIWIGEEPVPSGIAYRNYGTHNYFPQKEKAHEAKDREAARAHTEQTLTLAAQEPTYLIQQLPAKPEVLLFHAEEDANLHTHGGYETDLDKLRKNLQQRWEPHGIILLSEMRMGKIVSQVKATYDRGTLVHLRSREPDSDLFSALQAIAELINAIPARERLVQRWKAGEASLLDSRTFEIFTLEWLPLSRKIQKEDTQENREPYQARAAETILRLIGVNSAYAFGLEIATFLSDAPYITMPEAQVFLGELEAQYKEASLALSQTTPKELAYIVEKGRKMGFSHLLHEARKCLLPLDFQEDEKNIYSS